MIKLVCMGGKEFPVPERAKWIAMDKSGTWFWYVKEPEFLKNLGVWFSGDVSPNYGFLCTGIKTPEKGALSTQIYHID